MPNRFRHAPDPDGATRRFERLVLAGLSADLAAATEGDLADVLWIACTKAPYLATLAAREAGKHRSEFYALLKKHSISPAEFRERLRHDLRTKRYAAPNMGTVRWVFKGLTLDRKSSAPLYLRLKHFTSVRPPKEQVW